MNKVKFDYQISKLRPSLFQFALKFTKDCNDADDLVQDTFVRAISYANLFQEGSNLKGWLYTIMRNTFINRYRKTARERDLIDIKEDLNSEQLISSATGNTCNNKFLKDDIEKALNILPKENFTAFTRYFMGFKYHEIANELKIPIGTVKTRIHQARKQLKDHLTIYKC